MEEEQNQTNQKNQLIQEKIQKILQEETEEIEKEVGITQFLSKGDKILGIVKNRISDFIVNEIEKNTKKVHFFNKNQKIHDPEEYKNYKQKQNQEKNSQQEVQQDIPKKIQEEDLETGIKLLGEKNIQDIQKFYEDWESGEKKTFYEFIIEAPEDKQVRKDIHNYVREKLPYFDSEGIQANKNAPIAQIKIKHIKQARAKQWVTREARKQIKSQIFSFILHKTNVDTNQAIQQIAKFLRVNIRAFSTAGLKDRRGFTTQKVTVANQKSNILEFKKSLHHFKCFNLWFNDIQECEERLKLGDLYGNRFSIAIRLIQVPEQKVFQENFENLQKKGFINYYGMQRFGNGKVKTHKIGILVLQGEYRKVIDTLLYEDGNKHSDILNEYKETQDAKKALKLLPQSFKLARDIISFQMKNGPNTPYHCFNNLAKSQTSIFVHAFQSYVWNLLASKRIEKYGSEQIVLGDIIKIQQQQDQQQQQQQEENKQEDENQEKENENEDQDDEILTNCKFEIVTENNIDEIKQKYTFKDILIPIVGTDFSKDEKFKQFNLYQDVLDIFKQYNLELNCFKKSNLKSSLVFGGLRTLVFTAEDMEYKIIKFNQKETDFLTPYYNSEEDKHEENGKYQAMNLKFTLKKGCYATMLFREITKLSSSFQFQVQLNELYKEI